MYNAFAKGCYQATILVFMLSNFKRTLPYNLLSISMFKFHQKIPQQFAGYHLVEKLFTFLCCSPPSLTRAAADGPSLFFI
jgi:hypothetical protein